MFIPPQCNSTYINKASHETSKYRQGFKYRGRVHGLNQHIRTDMSSSKIRDPSLFGTEQDTDSTTTEGLQSSFHFFYLWPVYARLAYHPPIPDFRAAVKV
jgi:hypothetical protein